MTAYSRGEVVNTDRTMKTSPTVEQGFKAKTSVVDHSAARLLWNAARIPVLAILLLLEPAVRFICSLALVLGFFASVMFEISAAGPRFPFLWMLALSLGSGVVLFLYYGLIALLSR